MNLLLKYIIYGIDLEKDFGFKASDDFSNKLYGKLSLCFKENPSFKRCIINKNNYFLCIDDNDFKEIFGFKILENKIVFVEGLYMPQKIEEVSDTLKLLSEIISFCSEYKKISSEEKEKNESIDFEWL